MLECRVDVTGRAGSAHAPTFTVEGLAVLVGGRELRSGPSEASTKRALERLGKAAGDRLGQIS